MKMKKYLACILAGAMMCGLSACNGAVESSVAETEPVTEAATESAVESAADTEPADSGN